MTENEYNELIFELSNKHCEEVIEEERKANVRDYLVKNSISILALLVAIASFVFTFVVSLL